MAEQQQTEVQKWLTAIASYDKAFSAWEKRSKNIIERYVDYKALQRKTARFNILWSNVQTLVPAVFSRIPQPDVSRRFKDNDPVGRVAAMLLERALEYEVSHYPDYTATLREVVLDRFLGGRGTSWVRYAPEFQSDTSLDVEGAEQDMVGNGAGPDEQITDDSLPDSIIWESCPVDYVHWRDFGHVIARTWEEVTAVWRKVYMGRDALVKRFGEELGKEIPTDTKPEELKKSGIELEDHQACIYEIWDKESKSALWLSKSMDRILDECEDPLGLEEFWPCPKPLYATLTTDSLIPTPDFSLYQDQADQLDILADTIDGLIKALKVRGVYDAAVPELARLLTEGGNNDLIPVKNWAGFAEKQGLKGAIDLVDLAPITQALVSSYEASDKVIGQIYQISGISDIVRGETDPNETLGAQQMKGQYATLRLRDMQSEVARFASELLKIKAQIICSKYQPQTILELSAADQLTDADKMYVGPAIMLLKSNNMRAFRIEIEADSLVMMDENAEKQGRVDFLQAVGGFLKEAVQAPPELAPLLAQLLKFAVTGFKVGKQIEGEIDQAVDKFKQEAANPKPSPPNPDLLKIQAQTQASQQQLQASLQADAQKNQMTMQLEQQKQTLQAQQVTQQNQLEAQRQAMDTRNDQALKQMKMMFEKQAADSKNQMDLLIARLDNATKIQIAEIAAASVEQPAQITAAELGAQP